MRVGCNWTLRWKDGDGGSIGGREKGMCESSPQGVYSLIQSATWTNTAPTVQRLFVWHVVLRCDSESSAGSFYSPAFPRSLVLTSPNPKVLTPPLCWHTWGRTKPQHLDTCAHLYAAINRTANSYFLQINNDIFTGDKGHSDGTVIDMIIKRKIKSWTGKTAVIESLMFKLFEVQPDNYFRQGSRRVVATKSLQRKPLPSNMLAVRCHLLYSDMISGVIKDNELEHRHWVVYLHTLSPAPPASHSYWFTSLLNNMTFPQGQASVLMCRKFVHECTS